MRHFLPRRPLQLDPDALAQRRLRNLAVVAVLVAMGAAFGAGCLVSAQQIISERALWSRGMPGRVVHLSGRVEETQKLGLTLFYDYDLKYRLPDDDRVGVYRGEAPLLVARDGELPALVLRSPRAPGSPYLVEADLRPFELPVEVRARILTAAAG